MSGSATRKDSGTKRSMFARMLLRSTLRRGRSFSALLAMVVAAAAATAMLNLFVDVQAKLHDEFRNYGANVLVVSKDGQPLAADSLQRITGVAGDQTLTVPFGFVVAHTASGQAVVVAGTDFPAARKLNGWWSVTKWPQNSQDGLFGDRAARALGAEDQPIALTFHGKALAVKPAGILQTGASEDSRIYISLTDFENWTGLGPSTMQLAVPGSPQEISAVVQKLSQSLPDADVRPVRQVMEGEAHVLGKTRSTMFYSAILIIATAAICLFSTLVGWVYDRRRDYAVMKALGASAMLINGLFTAEAVIVGIAGSLCGFALGIGAAEWIGQANFHTSIRPRLSVLPPILAGSVILSLLAVVVPVLLLRRVQPATILRGE